MDIKKNKIQQKRGETNKPELMVDKNNKKLVVEPTHLKNMRKSNWMISAIFGDIKNI